jgi:hypothetical protein
MPQWSRRFENVCPKTIAMRVMSVTLFYSYSSLVTVTLFILLYSNLLTVTLLYLLYSTSLTFCFLRIVPPDKHHACDGSDFGWIVLTAWQGS